MALILFSALGFVGCTTEAPGDPDYAEDARHSPANLVVRIEELQEQVAALENEADTHDHYDLEERIAELEAEVEYLVTEMDSVVDFLPNWTISGGGVIRSRRRYLRGPVPSGRDPLHSERSVTGTTGPRTWPDDCRIQAPPRQESAVAVVKQFSARRIGNLLDASGCPVVSQNVAGAGLSYPVGRLEVEARVRSTLRR